MACDKAACIVKWTVFINRGAGNFPMSSPNRILLYLLRKNKEKKEKITVSTSIDMIILLQGRSQDKCTYKVKNVLKVYHTSMKNNVLSTLAAEKLSEFCDGTLWLLIEVEPSALMFRKLLSVADPFSISKDEYFSDASPSLGLETSSKWSLPFTCMISIECLLYRCLSSP